jgi:hypothetical protein
MIEVFGPREEIPTGYTGIVRWTKVNGAVLAIDGRYVLWSDLKSVPEFAIKYGASFVSWYERSSGYTHHIFYASRVLPFVWENLKDHPILGKILAAYMLGSDND